MDIPCTRMSVLDEVGSINSEQGPKVKLQDAKIIGMKSSTD